MSFYRTIIRQSFITAWQHKYLWFFGLFATLLASNFEIELLNRFTSQGSTPYDWQRWSQSGILNPQTWGNLMELARTNTGSFISILILIVVLLILALLLVWLSVVSQAALVSNINKAALSANKRQTRHDTTVGFQEGRRYFWPVLWLNVLVRVIVYGLAAASIVPVMIWSSGQGIIFSIVYLVVFIVFLGVALALALIAKYAIAAITLKDQTFKEAVISSWRLFWNNWLVSLEMAFILFAISLLATFAIIIVVMIIAIPLVFLYLITLAIGSYILYIAALAVGVIISLGIVIIGGSIVTVIQTTAWVTFYNQLSNRKGVQSKIERVFAE